MLPDHQAEAETRRASRERCQHGPSFETGTVEIANNRGEVVEEPRMLDERLGVGLFPNAEDGLVGRVLR